MGTLVSVLIYSKEKNTYFGMGAAEVKDIFLFVALKFHCL